MLLLFVALLAELVGVPIFGFFLLNTWFPCLKPFFAVVTPVSVLLGFSVLLLICGTVFHQVLLVSDLILLFVSPLCFSRN